MCWLSGKWSGSAGPDGCNRNQKTKGGPLLCNEVFVLFFKLILRYQRCIQYLSKFLRACKNKGIFNINVSLPPCCSGPDPHPEGRQDGRMVEIHRQHHLRVQAGREPDPPRRPVPVGPRQGHRLQVSQDQAWEEVLVARERRGLPRAGRRGGRQRQPGHPVEGHVGAQAQEVPAAGEERQVQEALGGGERRTRRRRWARRREEEEFERKPEQRLIGDKTEERGQKGHCLCCCFLSRSMKRNI